MTTESNSFTINLPNPKNNTGSPESSNDTRSIDYIIERNRLLDEENKELRQENQELAHKIEEEEEYNDSNQKKNNNLKMVLKNLLETKNLQGQVLELNNEINTLERDIHDRVYKTHVEDYQLVCLTTLCNVFASLMYFTYSNIVFNIIVFVLSCFINYSIFIKIRKNQAYVVSEETTTSTKIKKIKATIKTHQESIKKMDETSDYLNEYIDII
jgi:vacuolar-type H+-ATPase subunit I/STV1